MELDAPKSPEGVRIGRFLFLGPSDAGKTTFAGTFIRDILQWPAAHIRSVAPPTKPSLSRIIHAEHIPLDINDRDAQEACFGRIWREGSAPYDQGGSDLGLVVDDADFYFSSMGRTYGSDSLAAIVKLGREAGISQVYCTQGSSTTVKDLLNNASLVGIGCTSEPNIVDYARRYMQDVPDAVYVIGHLPKYVFLLYTPTQATKLQGTAKVVNGHIEVKPWDPNPEEQEVQEEEASPSTEPSEEASSPDESASTPDAERSSPTATAPASAASTTPNGSGNASVPPRPGSEIDKP